MFGRHAAQAGDETGGISRVGRLALASTMRHRREERGIGFHQQPVFGKLCSNGLQVLGVLEGYDARKRDCKSQIEYFAAEFGTRGEAVDEGGERALLRLFLENACRIVFRIARVHDQRQTRFTSHGNMRAKQGLLHRAVGLVVVVVEPGFTDTDDLGMGCRFQQSPLAQIGMLVRLVRVDAYRGPDIVFARRGADNLVPLALACGDVEKTADTGRTGAVQDALLVLDEAFVLEMAVGIDQRQADASSGISRRGNTPSGFAIAKPLAASVSSQSDCSSAV